MGPSGEPEGDPDASRLHLCERTRNVIKASIDSGLMAEGWISNLDERRRLNPPAGTAPAAAFGSRNVAAGETSRCHALDNEPD
jgi:hypothetical protein